MTLQNVISYIDSINPNSFSAAAKTAWVNEVEGLIQTEVMLLDPTADGFVTYAYPADADTELLVKPPHSKLYWPYLSAMIDFANGDFDCYQASVQLFSAQLNEYTRWYAQFVRPADKGAD